MGTVIQQPIWEESIQTALDFVNSTLGDIDSVGGEKAAYESARSSLESLLSLILGICRSEWTASEPINTWVYNYKRYVKGPSCDCFTVKDKGTHISDVYKATGQTATIAGTAGGSGRYKKGVADSIVALCDPATDTINNIKRFNCCMNKIEKGVQKEHQVLGAMANKRHLNGLKRQAEKPMVSQSKTYQNGNHMGVASAISAGGAAASSGAASAGLITDTISASLSGILDGAVGGNFAAGIFGNASVQLGCESYSFQDGIVSNISGSLGFNFGFSLCSPKFGASANVGSFYKAGVFAKAQAALDATLNLWDSDPKVNYSANTNTSVLDATLSPPYENFDRKKNCKCAGSNDAGLAGNLIPPNGNLDTHEKIVERAHDQTREVKEKIEELKCKVYCCGKKKPKKKDKTKNDKDELFTKEALKITADFPTLNKLDNIILTDKESFYCPVINKDQIITINGVQATDTIPNDRVLPIITDLAPKDENGKPLTDKEKCSDLKPNNAGNDDIDLEKINTINIKTVNDKKNKSTKCQKVFSKSKDNCLVIPNIVEVNNDLKQNIITDEDAMNVIIQNNGIFINSMEDLEDKLNQQYFLKSVDVPCGIQPEVYQIINNEIVEIIE